MFYFVLKDGIKLKPLLSKWFTVTTHRSRAPGWRRGNVNIYCGYTDTGTMLVSAGRQQTRQHLAVVGCCSISGASTFTTYDLCKY